VYEALSYRNGLKLQAPSIIVCMAIMQQEYVAAKYLTCIMCVHIIYFYISTTPARLHHHPTPPHAPCPQGWKDADLHFGVLREDGRGEGADCGGVRHQSRCQGKADDAPCLGARAPCLSRSAPLSATSYFEFAILV
jgi:hypothetical protein